MPMTVLPRLPRFQRAVDYFYLNWLWRIAEGLHLMRLRRTDSLAVSDGSLVRFTIQRKWSPRRWLQPQTHGFEPCGSLMAYAARMLPVGFAPTVRAARA